MAVYLILGCRRSDIFQMPFRESQNIFFFPFPTHPETLRNEQFHLFVLLMAVFSWYKEILSTCVRPLSHTDVEQVSICCSWLGRTSWEKSAGSWGKKKRIWSSLSNWTECSDLALKVLIFGVAVVRITKENATDGGECCCVNNFIWGWQSLLVPVGCWTSGCWDVL